MPNYAIQIKLRELAEQAAHGLENRPQIVADAFRLAQSENDETLFLVGSNTSRLAASGGIAQENNAR